MRRALGLLVLLCATGGPCGAREVRIILVFPFDNLSSRPDLGWISESFSEILSVRLAGPYRYPVEREERNAAYAQLDLPSMTPLTLASEYKVAETLGVDWAVIGSFTVEGQRLTARARMLDMRRTRLAPLLEVTGELAELVELQTQLAWRLLATTDTSFTVGTEEDFRRRFPNVRLDSFENYVRGILAGEPESRVRFLKEADRLDPADHRAAFQLGRFYFDGKDYANSASWLSKMAENDSNHLESLFLLGVDDFFLGKEAEAEKAFSVLAEQVPLNEVLNNLGVMETRRGRYQEALAHFERAYQADSSDFDFSFNLGLCLWHLQRYQEAAKHLEEAARTNDEDPAPHALLATTLDKLGDSEGHRRQLQWLADREGTSVANASEDILPQARLKKNYEGRAFFLLALALSESLEERSAGDPPGQHGPAHLALGKAFLADGHLSEAQAELLEAVSLLPEDADAHLALAQVYEIEGRHADAARELTTSLKLRDGLTAHLWLARAYLSLGQPEAARAQAQAALQLDPGNASAVEVVDQARRRTPLRGKTP